MTKKKRSQRKRMLSKKVLMPVLQRNRGLTYFNLNQIRNHHYKMNVQDGQIPDVFALHQQYYSPFVPMNIQPQTLEEFYGAETPDFNYQIAPQFQL